MNLSEIKDKVLRTIAERNELAKSNLDLLPSKYWQDFCKRTKYVFDLSDEQLKDIRYHTYHLTSDIYLHYYFGDPKAFWEGNRLSWSNMLSPLISEPDNGIGFVYGHPVEKDKTCRISSDLLRYMRIIDKLKQVGVLSHSIGDRRLLTMLEIGSGYGGIAYQVLKYGVHHRYYIVDLPEVLIFPAVYLAINLSHASLYIYDPLEPMPTNFDDYEIVLLPNYRSSILRSQVQSFDAVINVASFQEMTVKQVREYLNLAKDILKDDGVLYSWNMDRNPANKETGLNVSGLLHETFTRVIETEEVQSTLTSKDKLREFLKAIASKVGLLQPLINQVPPQVYKEYICRKK